MKKIIKYVKIAIWGVLYTLPFWVFLMRVNLGNSGLTLYSTMAEFVDPNNFIYTAFYEIFGDTLHLVSQGSGIIMYLSYFVILSFIHICTDLLLFLPHICRFCIEKPFKSVDEDDLID